MEASIIHSEKMPVLSDETFNRIVASEPDKESSTTETIHLSYKSDGWGIYIMAEKKDGYRARLEEAYHLDGKDNEYISYDLTDAQMQHFDEPIEEMRRELVENEEDIKAWNRDLYAYHGVSRSDFI